LRIVTNSLTRLEERVFVSAHFLDIEQTFVV
jgi:hypothetical protein